MVPGMVLQIVGLLVVLGYYYLPAFHSLLARLMEIRQASGFALGMASTALFGGLLPFLQRDPSGKIRYTWIQGFGLVAFWAYKGFEIDLWYRTQAHIVGTGHDFMTIAVKVAIDQFVYCPVLAVPLTAVVYHLVDSNYDWAGLGSDIRAPRWYWRRALPLLISNLGVWIPAVAIIYALPTPLQLPLQNIILCFYTLVVAHQTRAGEGDGA